MQTLLLEALSRPQWLCRTLLPVHSHITSLLKLQGRYEG